MFVFAHEDKLPTLSDHEHTLHHRSIISVELLFVFVRLTVILTSCIS